MLELMAVLGTRTSIEFEVMLAEGAQPVSRSLLIATFLAVLELTRMAAIRIYQSIDEAGFPSGPIHLRQTAEAGDRSWMDQIAENM